MNIKKHIYFSSFSIEEIIQESKDNVSIKIKSNKGWKNENLYNQIISSLSYEVDKDNIKMFFSSLGRTDLQEQIKSLEYEIKYLEDRIIEEKDKFKEKSKVNIVFYLFLGVAIILVVV